MQTKRRKRLERKFEKRNKVKQELKVRFHTASRDKAKDPEKAHFQART